MHTNLSFLDTGEPWPARRDERRVARYALNRARFEGRDTERDGEHGQCRLNYFRLTTLKLADLIGKPTASAGLARGEKSPDPAHIDAIWDIAHESCLHNLAVMAVCDMSRYGEAILRVGRGPNGKGRISLVRPDIWFPVVDEEDVGRFRAHVLAWVLLGERSGFLRHGPRRQTLVCEIHTPGFVEKRRYAMKNGRIGTLLRSETFATGLVDFAVIPARNGVTSDRAFGQDDYEPISHVVRELERRFSQIAKVLDKHTEPTMQGPASALSRGDDGRLRLHTGEYLVNQDDGDEHPGQVSYLTWDAKLDANFAFIDKLSSQLFALSEMGGALLGDFDARAGNLPSGSALRRLLFAPLNKAARIRAELDSALKKAIVLCATYYGVDFSDSFVTIRWADALPADKRELAELIHLRTAGARTLSTASAVKALDGVDDEEAVAETERIREEG